MTRLDLLVLLALLLYGLTMLAYAWCGGSSIARRPHYDTTVESLVFLDEDGFYRIILDLRCGCGLRRYREIGP